VTPCSECRVAISHDIVPEGRAEFYR
jgi:hypothetical protein